MIGGLALSLAAWAAAAAEVGYRLAIPVTSYSEALIELGVEANVTILGTSACGPGGAVGLKGQRTLEAALRELTAGAPCVYRILDAHTVRISAAPGVRRAPEPPRVTTVSELLITATKRPADINHVAASISVVGRQQIEVTGATDVGQTSDQVSGVLTTNLGPGRDKLILRGLSDGAFTGRARSTVGSYLDEIPINYNAPDPDLPLVDVDRIEVVRGPQGALYGSGAVSGVYRIVTRKPDTEDLVYGGATMAATTKGGAPSDEVEAYANLPVVADHVAVRMVGYYDLQGGYIDNAELSLSNVDRTTREGGRVSVRLQANADWSLDLSGALQRLRSNDTQYATPSVGPTERLSRVQEGHKNDFSEASAALHGELGWASLDSALAVISHDFSSQFDASAVLGALHLDPQDLGVYGERTQLSMVVEDTVLRSVGGGRLSWLAGVYALTTVEKSPSTLDFQATGGPLQHAYEEHRRDRLREGAVYAEASYELRPRWTVTAGGRLFANEVRTEASITSILADPRTFLGTRTSNGFSPKLSIQHTFDGDALVYALFSEGYRPGGFNSGGFFQIKPSRVSFSPDRLANYELGLKTRLFDGRVSLRSALFYDRWKNIQTDAYRPSGLPYTANVGDANVWGLESEGGFDLGRGFSLQADLLLEDSHLTRTNPDFATSINPGDAQIVSSLPGVPKFSAGLLAIYQHPLPRNLTFRLVGETSYVGRSALSFDANLPAPQGQYERTKLSAEIAGRGWIASLFVTNPTDAAGDTFAYGNPFSFGQVRQTTPQRPRTIGLRLAADY